MDCFAIDGVVSLSFSASNKYIFLIILTGHDKFYTTNGVLLKSEGKSSLVARLEKLTGYCLLFCASLESNSRIITVGYS